MVGNSSARNRLKLAELTSGVGAFVLGVGLGALFASTFRQSAVVVLVTGGLLHGWGMLDKHRLELSGAAHKVWWVNLDVLGVLGGTWRPRDPSGRFVDDTLAKVACVYALAA